MASIKCSGCEKEIEWCAACDEADCGAAICFECLVVEIGESVGPTHRPRPAAPVGTIDPERR